MAGGRGGQKWRQDRHRCPQQREGRAGRGNERRAEGNHRQRRRAGRRPRGPASRSNDARHTDSLKQAPRGSVFRSLGLGSVSAATPAPPFSPFPPKTHRFPRRLARPLPVTAPARPERAASVTSTWGRDFRLSPPRGLGTRSAPRRWRGGGRRAEVACLPHLGAGSGPAL